MRLNETAAFLEVKAEADVLSSASISVLCQDKERTDGLFFENDFGILDCSRQQLSSNAMKCLIKLANQQKVGMKIESMFSGDKLNSTENRAVLHVALRAPSSEKICVDGKDVVPEVHEVLERIRVFSDNIRSGTRVGYTGKPLRNVISIGIGGSYLGPEFVYEALRTDPFAKKGSSGRNIHFLANVDPIDIERSLEGFNQEETLVVVVSKTFTTAETLLNARSLRQWLLKGLKDEAAIEKHVAAVSTNLSETAKFGIANENVFGFWDWVGGRYSVSSAVGVLPLALHYGFNVVQDFLNGAHAMDVHFRKTPLEQNWPVVTALIAHWNATHLKHDCVAILPYTQALVRFAAHVQQLNMESNGKTVTLDGQSTAYATGPVVFGEPGTNGQHSFYQLMHQGSTVVPAELIGFAKTPCPHHYPGEAVPNHDELMSNFFAQPDALALGKSSKEVADSGVPTQLVPHKTFSGNRPSTCLLMPQCTAYYCGVLLSLYEHRTAVEGFLLDVNSFDQWGVELGKVLAKTIRSFFEAYRKGDLNKADSIKKELPYATRRLLDAYVKMNL